MDGEKRYKACLVCNHDMALRKEWLWRCRTCGFLLSTLSPGAGAGTGGEGLDPLRRMNFEILLDRLEKIAPLSGKTLLEIGCSTGTFLDAAGGRGIKVTGIEPEKGNACSARLRGFEVIEGFFPQALPAGQTFDMIAFNDVFEHLPDPAASLQACEVHLNLGGFLILNLPDSSGILYRIADIMDRFGIGSPLERLWQKNFSSPHLSYFNRRNLRMLATAKTCLRLVHESSLKAMITDGLKDRVAASAAGPVESLIMYAGLLLLAPLQERGLPPDILLQVYAKSR